MNIFFISKRAKKMYEGCYFGDDCDCVEREDIKENEMTDDGEEESNEVKETNEEKTIEESTTIKNVIIVID